MTTKNVLIITTFALILDGNSNKQDYFKSASFKRRINLKYFLIYQTKETTMIIHHNSITLTSLKTVSSETWWENVAGVKKT